MPKKLDVVIPPTDKTAEEVAKALFKLGGSQHRPATESGRKDAPVHASSPGKRQTASGAKTQKTQ